MERTLTKAKAEALAVKLDVSLDVGICHACLSFVSFALDDGDPPRSLAGTVQRVTRDLWHEGLAEPALAAAGRAQAAGVPDAAAGLADLVFHGQNSIVARALVLRLAAELSRRSKAHYELMVRTRERLDGSPELN